MSEIEPGNAPDSNTQKADGTLVSPAGYRKKPIWIYLTAFILMLSPLGNLMYSLASMKVSHWYKPSVWLYWARFVTPSTWILLTLLFAAGIALLFVRKWTWNFSMAVLAIVLIYDVAMIKQFLLLGPLAVIAMIVATVSFGLLLYFSEFRKPYLNPRLRWWETSPRFKVEFPVKCSTIHVSGSLTDISRTGVLVEWPADFKLPDIEGTAELSLHQDLILPVHVARRTARGYGLQFRDLSSTQKNALIDFIKTLEVDPTQIRR